MRFKKSKEAIAAMEASVSKVQENVEKNVHTWAEMAKDMVDKEVKECTPWIEVVKKNKGMPSNQMEVMNATLEEEAKRKGIKIEYPKDVTWTRRMEKVLPCIQKGRATMKVSLPWEGESYLAISRPEWKVDDAANALSEIEKMVFEAERDKIVSVAAAPFSSVSAEKRDVLGIV
ncbi:hypothetical protein L7F22_005622 [Adiantum nelumboides]|nr:hypothetical protein [Adiantum nelumboides]